MVFIGVVFPRSGGSPYANTAIMPDVILPIPGVLPTDAAVVGTLRAGRPTTIAGCPAKDVRRPKVWFNTLPRPHDYLGISFLSTVVRGPEPLLRTAPGARAAPSRPLTVIIIIPISPQIMLNAGFFTGHLSNRGAPETGRHPDSQG